MSNTSPSVTSLIESLLFIHGEPLSRARLAKALSVSEKDIASGLDMLRKRYEDPDSGLTLIEKGKDVEIATRPDNAGAVERLIVADREETLGKATLETLSVVAYRAPVSRASIDAIRGVNSSFALRSLLLRGLIERRSNPLDAREYEYEPSLRLLELLGIGSIEELPDYGSLARDAALEAVVAGDTVPREHQDLHETDNGH